DIIKNFRLWKIFPSVFAFQSTPELMFGLYLLYYFRVFERQIGPTNTHITVSSLLEVLSLVLLKGMLMKYKLHQFACVRTLWPHICLICSILSRHSCHIAIPYFGLNFSDNSFIYLAGLQLLLSSWKRSLIPGVFGLVAGSLYRLNVFGIRKMKNQSSTGFAPIVEPPESSVAMLVSMGFDGNAARQALMRARNDINAATNILLESQSH
ncbi:hypothetical protein EJB05_53234, partial [Eragrostis curvula]